MSRILVSFAAHAIWGVIMHSGIPISGEPWRGGSSLRTSSPAPAIILLFNVRRSDRLPVRISSAVDVII